MVNKKRDLNSYKKRLGRYRLNRADIIAIEKLLRVYADAHEMKYATKYGQSASPPAGRKHMPRKFADTHIKIGRYQPFYITIGWGEYGIHYAGVNYIYEADSIKFLPKFTRKRHYIQIACRPGIILTFTPLTTTIYAQTNYATGKELKVMKEVVLALEQYLYKATGSTLNNLKLDG